MLNNKVTVTANSARALCYFGHGESIDVVFFLEYGGNLSLRHWSALASGARMYMIPLHWPCRV
jgi:hypothetical protein